MSGAPFVVFAMAGGGSSGQQQGAAGLLGMIIPMLLIFAIFYFMLIRPQQRREKERQAMINAIKSGDRILFCGGMIGSVVNVKDRILVVKVADNVKVEIARGAVLRVLDKDDKDVDTNG
jgi:preprotein translocase subunit YajC